MGEYADMSWDPCDSNSWTDRYYLKRRDYNLTIKHDRRAPHKIMSCSHCGKQNLRFYEEETDVWHLAETGDDGNLTRHVCKFKGKWGAK